ncbi:transmembrane and TPR repeat-containing protein 4-like [Mizuhopecten yessoensis]|uniref:transmembrane and TPR repeat-containing protein 4-like n=1 Tax=Mizuhopecten yessoensis TaxID=6573 RepID=UPI000B459CF8|nr:transmembrane and TPR repeat-containing protein 4-like [Mizuhopecten yessoensis]XP_021372744.1 transmembrane and TPR repeat-containing protein 4-like [Mizuhopecten yessoensis]
MYKVQQNGSSSHSKGANGHALHNDTRSQGSWDDAIPVPRLSLTSAYVVVFVLAGLCFANSYDGDFVFDDSEAILNNKDLSTDVPVTDLFFHDFWGKNLASKTSHKSYRPLTVLTFRWSHSLAGGLYPLGFHIVNILLHSIVSVLMLSLFSNLFSECIIAKETGSLAFGTPRASLLCAILFAVHPIHTESVAGVVGRADLLCALLFILSFKFYVNSCVQAAVEKGDSVLCRPSSFSLPHILLSIVLCGMSVLCKETGITVIGICSAFDIIMICRVDVLAAVGLKKEFKSLDNGHSNGSTGHREDDGSWITSLVKRQLLLLCGGLTILATRWRLMGSTTPTFQVFDNPHSFVNGTLTRVLNYNYLYSINGFLLVNPWWLCFDWSMGCLPVIKSLMDPRVLAVFAFWLVLGGLLFAALNGAMDREKRCLSMGLALIVVPFLPATNLLFRVGFVIAERVLYLSTAGYCIIIVLGVQRLVSTHTFPQVVRYTLIFLVAIFTARCVHRSYEWRKEMSLFEAGVNVCPLNAKVHYNIAKLNGDRGNVEKAIEKYRDAISLNHEYDQAMNNLANILKDRGDLQEAEELLMKAVGIRDEFAAAWMNLGIVQSNLKKNDLAEKSYFRALLHRRKYPDCYYNLGNLYLDLKMHNEAIQAWRNATLQRPTHFNAWNNMVILLDNLNQVDQAEAVGKEALKYIGQDAQMYINLANVMGKADRYKESEQYFLRAIKIDSNLAKAHANLGVLYHRWDKHDLAEKSYKRALQLEPDSVNTHDNLKMLYRKIGKANN